MMAMALPTSGPGWAGALLAATLGLLLIHEGYHNVKHEHTVWKCRRGLDEFGTPMDLPEGQCSLNPDPISGCEVIRFREAGFNEVKRFSYPRRFDANAVVVDIGSFVGLDLVQFMQNGAPPTIQVYTYEPVPSIRAELAKNVAAYPGIKIHPYGVGYSNEKMCFITEGGASTGQDRDATHAVPITDSRCTDVSEIVDIRSVIEPLSRVDLLHINCEGCELGVLKRLTEGDMSKIKAIEVQVHGNWVKPEDYCDLEHKLQERGYRLEYRYQFVWELWVRK